jgi:hypothetical protein
MTEVKKLEGEIQKLSYAELTAFRKWFSEFDSEEWDRQIEEDIRAGKLDEIAKDAIAAHRDGRSKEL